METENSTRKGKRKKLRGLSSPGPGVAIKFKWRKTLGYAYHRVRVSQWRLYTEMHVIFLLLHDFYYIFTNL